VQVGTANRATRATSAGLAVVVVCLAGFSTWAAYSTQTRVEQAQRSSALYDRYVRATSAIVTEEVSGLHYVVGPSSGNLAQLGLAQEALIAAVDQIATRGGEHDALLVRDLRTFHDHYLVASERLLGAVAIGDLAEARRIDEEEVHPLFHSMNVLLAAATEQRLGEADATFAALNRTASWMQVAAPVVFAIGFLLVLGLWRILEQYNRATRETYLKIEQLSRLRGEFVATVSHEFRTPLTGIQGFSELMRDEVLTIDAMREYAGDINKDARRLNRLMNDMLDLDQMESGHLKLNVQSVDLNRCVVDAAAQFTSSAADHPIKLHLDDALPRLSGDAERLTQLVTNLLSNAIKYSPGGGAIEIQTTHEAQSVLLTVRDHGIGISVEHLDMIFDRYFRIETAATQSIQGTGLGLSIVRQIVRLFEGKVWATSEAGEGSIFHVQLPLIESAATIPNDGHPQPRVRAA